MKIENVNIKNFKGISKEEANLQGKSVYLYGPNEAGKSSFIDAIWVTLTGKNIPTRPIKTGEIKSEVEVDLGEYVAKIEFTKKGKPKFSLESKEAGPIKQPRSVLNDRLGIIDFDPAEFFALSSAKQVEYYCKITDIDFRDLNDKYDELYEERTFHNGELKRLRDKADIFDKDLAAKEPIVVSKLYSELQGIRNHNEQVQKVVDKIEEKITRGNELKKELEQLTTEIGSGNEWLESNKFKETKELEEKIHNVDKENAEISEAREQQDVHEQLAKSEKSVEDINKEMLVIKDDKKEAISKNMNIEGMEYDGEIFTLDGLPFENTQINSAAQVITGLKIGLHLLKDVRILRFDGSIIDTKNMAAVEKWASENDIQLAVEFVDRDSDKLAIQIQED